MPALGGLRGPEPAEQQAQIRLRRSVPDMIRFDLRGYVNAG